MNEKKIIAATFEKIEAWMKGEENTAIDKWLESDFEAYENLAWIYKECARLGWNELEKPMLSVQDPEIQAVAKMVWLSAVEYRGRESK